MCSKPVKVYHMDFEHWAFNMHVECWKSDGNSLKLIRLKYIKNHENIDHISYSLASLKAPVISLINWIEISLEYGNASKMTLQTITTHKNPSSFSNNFESKKTRDLRTTRGFSTNIKANRNRWVSYWKLKPPRPIRFHFCLTQLRL